jgi:signal peptidase I
MTTIEHEGSWQSRMIVDGDWLFVKKIKGWNHEGHEGSLRKNLIWLRSEGARS